MLFVEALDCPNCGTLMQVISVLTDPTAVGSILRHLGLAVQPLPLLPAPGGDLLAREAG